MLAENQTTSSEICNAAGWYSSVCVELDVDSLAINTLLQSPHVADVEGTSATTAFGATAPVSLDDLVGGNPVTVYDETARCAEAFRILRTMASVWMRDISVHKNVFADFQVVHFYRLEATAIIFCFLRFLIVFVFQDGCVRQMPSCTIPLCCAHFRI